MTADDEVRNIRWTLEKIHHAFHHVNNEFEKALPEVNHLMSKLEQFITNIADESNNIRNVTVKIISNFPNRTVYLLTLLILEVTIGIIAIALIYFIIVSFSQLYHKQFMLTDKCRNEKLSRKNDKKHLQKYDPEALTYYNRLSFKSSDMPDDKNDKKWWNEMDHLDNRRLLQYENV
ncbi:hypothetical protein ACH3XW_1330 [Acanthocheilonema viteae]